MSLEAGNHQWEAASGQPGKSPMEKIKRGEEIIQGLIKASASSQATQRENMYAGLKALSPEDLIAIRDDGGPPELKTAAALELMARGVQVKSESKKQKPRKRTGAGQVRNASGSARSASSDFEFEEESVTSGGEDVNPPESQEEIPNHMGLGDLIRYIVLEKYKDVELSDAQKVEKKAAEIVANIILHHSEPIKYSTKPEDETDIIRFKRQMETAGFETAEDVKREFDRLGARAEKIKAYATERAAGGNPSESDSTVSLYGKEVAGYMADGDDIEHAYGRMLVRRINERLFSSLSNTLGQNLR